MTNRREMLQISMAATVLPLDAAALWAAPAGAGRDEPVALYKVFYDTRFAASRAFGERMATQGIATAATTGDITAFWYNNLYPRWQRGAAAIAGLTARGPLFCLEQLARDHGMRVIFRAQHSSSTAGSVRHEIEGAAELMAAVQRMAMGDDWVGAMSRIVAHYPHTRSLQARAEVHTEKPAVQVPEDEKLFSWVIAPVARS